MQSSGISFGWSPYTQRDGPKQAMKESSYDAPRYSGHLLVRVFRVVWFRG
jgi:hypothetical protein